MTSHNGHNKRNRARSSLYGHEIAKKFDEQDLWNTENPISFIDDNHRNAVFSSALLKIIIDSIAHYLTEDQKEVIFKNILSIILDRDLPSLPSYFYEIQMVSNSLKESIIQIIDSNASTNDNILLKNPPIFNYQAFFNLGSRYRNDFRILEKLGRGGFGNVYKVVNKIDGQYYAIKRIPEYKSKQQNVNSNEIIREIEALAKLSHVNIVRYFAAWEEYELVMSNKTLRKFAYSMSTQLSNSSSNFNPNGDHNRNSWIRVPSVRRQDSRDDNIVFEHSPSSIARQATSVSNGSQSNSYNNKSMQIVPASAMPTAVIPRRHIISIQMELCDETLENWLSRRNCRIKHSFKKVNFNTAKRMFQQILHGVAYMHSQSFIHRDLKPPNIFLIKPRSPDEFVVKIGDFGLSRFTPLTSPLPNEFCCSNEECAGKLTTNLGTRLYVAPEVLLPDGNYNSKSDMYSLGVILLELLYPFSTQHEKLAMIKSILDENVFPPDFKSFLPSECQDLILKLLSKDPNDRPSAPEIIDSFIFLSQDSNITGLLSQLKFKDDQIHDLEEKVKMLQSELDRFKRSETNQI